MSASETRDLPVAAAARVDPAAPTVAISAAPHPERIGPYKILQLLGEGGMGVVYLADQDRPVRRRVALKLVKLGMDTREVIGRFESERQALALMNHPNVATVHEAGMTETGRPFFMMEHVPGEPITAYCDKHRLTIPQRLELFGHVCHAIQHAHQKGILHRDVKPSNVLVMLQDGQPCPKVIDFGIAKATNQHLTERTVFTEHGRLIGTPEYMSPEQAEMTTLDIDTRTDIYALGVLLYELLTGNLPFESRVLRRVGYAEMQKIIREVEPQKPSARLSVPGPKPRSLTSGQSASPDAPTVAAPALNAPIEDSCGAPDAVAERRQTDYRSLVRLLRGDLDWITMKCMEKDRTRRYETASALASELERYRNGEPVLAGPPTFTYRMGKFVQRNRAAVIAACIVAFSLIAGLAGTTWGVFRAVAAVRQQRLERQRAEAEADTARRVAFFGGETLAGVSSTLAQRGDTTALMRVMDDAATRGCRCF